MTLPEPDITLDVDLRNPGQFFACCGILELASRLWPGSAENDWREPEGWFANGAFHVASYSRGNEPPLSKILNLFAEVDPLFEHVDLTNKNQSIAPLVFAKDTSAEMRLDWWLLPASREQKSSLKTWAGRTGHVKDFIPHLLTSLRQCISAAGVANPRDLFSWMAPATSRFGVDPWSSWDALTEGFSPNIQNLEVMTSPATELLAAIGLQRVRPAKDDKGGFLYSTWACPLAVTVIPAASAGYLPGFGQTFRFTLKDRGSAKAFNWAIPWR